MVARIQKVSHEGRSEASGLLPGSVNNNDDDVRVPLFSSKTVSSQNSNLFTDYNFILGRGGGGGGESFSSCHEPEYFNGITGGSKLILRDFTSQILLFKGCQNFPSIIEFNIFSEGFQHHLHSMLVI